MSVEKTIYKTYEPGICCTGTVGCMYSLKVLHSSSIASTWYSGTKANSDSANSWLLPALQYKI